MDDNFFSDGDFDDLPNDYLAKLEHNAIQLTQARTQARARNSNVAPSSDYGDDIDEEDLDDAVVIDESRSTPVFIPTLRRNIPGQASQREQFLQQRYGTTSNPHPSIPERQKTVIPPRQFNDPAPAPAPAPARPIIAQHESTVIEQVRQPSFSADEGVEALQKQIQELLKQREALESNVNTLKSEVNTKTGEIAIVRSKHEKTVKQYQQEMVAQQKLNEERLAKQDKALEAARNAEKNATTERDFIKIDLQESERARKLNKAKDTEAKGLLTTPKKMKNLPHRDGFDDDEIESLSLSRVSPSKFQKRLAGSPSRPGGKRKRKVADSPIAALEVQQIGEPPAEKVEAKEIVLDELIIDSLSKPDDRFDFLGTMLDHRVSSGYLRTFQELEKYALPSNPKESFESILLGKIPTLGSKISQKYLPIDFCELLISMWSNCMKEKYLQPIYLFIDMLTSALEIKTTSVAPYITDSLVPLAQLTADLVVIPRFMGHPPQLHEKNISASACLALLHLTALGCMSEQEKIVQFWKLMRFDFVLLMLSPNHPTADFEMMLHLLSTSVFRESFGAITGDNIQAQKVVGNILDRLTFTLSEIPPLPRSSEKMDLGVLSGLRLKVLMLMTSMTRSPFASRAMAMHPLAIGRLVSLISDELDDLYDYKARHEESSRIISLATRLLYYLITSFDNEIDIQKKLSVIRGGSQKYLLCLSRLNFSEDDLVLESRIDSDVAACALEMLELVVTPDEGDAIYSAFSSNS